MRDLVKETLKRILEAEEAVVEQRTDTQIVRGPHVNKIEVGRRGISGSIIFHPDEWKQFTRAVALVEPFQFTDETGMDVKVRVVGELVILDTGIHMGEVTVPIADVLGASPENEDSELQIYSTEPSGAMREERLSPDDTKLLIDLMIDVEGLLNTLDDLKKSGDASKLSALVDEIDGVKAALGVAAGQLSVPELEGDMKTEPSGAMGEQEPEVPEGEPEGPAEKVAKAFHETYERLAPEFGYETREDSAKPWDEVPEENKNLMIAVVSDLLEKGVIEAGTPEELPVEEPLETPVGGGTEEM